MTRYEDGSPYAYSPGTVPYGVEAVNVGWLEKDSEFPRGEAPAEFVQSLALLCRDDSRNAMRGLFPCQLPHQQDPGYPVSIIVGNQEVVLGNAEVRVVDGDGRWLIAPNLIHHYVTAHSYLPPVEFVEAVTSRRSAPRE